LSKFAKYIKDILKIESVCILQASNMSSILAILPSYNTDFLALKCLSVFAGRVKPSGRGELNHIKPDRSGGNLAGRRT